MSVRGLSRFWERLEVGWKILTVLFTLVSCLVMSIGWAIDIKSKADKVPAMEQAIQRTDRNIARIAEKLGVRTEDPK